MQSPIHLKLVTLVGLTQKRVNKLSSPYSKHASLHYHQDERSYDHEIKRDQPLHKKQLTVQEN